MITTLLTPERYHAKNHVFEFENCWRCQRARAICRTKIRFDSWQEAEGWVREFNEQREFADCVTRYRCRWCGGWHMTKANGPPSSKRAEKQRRKWLVRRAG